MKNAIIIEDDVIPNNKIIIQYIQNLLKIIIITLFHLSHVLRSYSIKITDNMFTSAYVVNKRFVEKISKCEYIGLSIDDIFSKVEKSYEFYPQMFNNQRHFRNKILNKLPKQLSKSILNGCHLFIKHTKISLLDIIIILFSLLFIAGIAKSSIRLLTIVFIFLAVIVSYRK